MLHDKTNLIVQETLYMKVFIMQVRFTIIQVTLIFTEMAKNCYKNGNTKNCTNCSLWHHTPCFNGQFTGKL